LKAIVGLGNPGKKYRETRHNVGFAVLDEFAKRHGRLEFDFWSDRMQMVIWRPAGSAAVLLAKPLTFMNNSGEAVGELVRFFRVELSDLLVVLDEAQLPLGKLRARARGSAGGHNGLKSIIAHIGEEFSRLRLGVGRGDARRDLADHVLSGFDPEERAEVERMIARAADASELFVTDGIAAVMNQYNSGDPATTE
jgi:PTH1 family peptidyl-tRNA hydrolase